MGRDVDRRGAVPSRPRRRVPTCTNDSREQRCTLGLSATVRSRARRRDSRRRYDHGQPHHPLAGVGALLPGQQLLPSVQSQPGTRTRHTRDGDPDAISAVSGAPVPAPVDRTAGAACVGCVAGRALQGTAQVPQLGYLLPPGPPQRRAGQAVACPENGIGEAGMHPIQDAHRSTTPERGPSSTRRPETRGRHRGGRRPGPRWRAAAIAAGPPSPGPAGRDPRRHQRAAFGGSAWLRPPVSAMR